MTIDKAVKEWESKHRTMSCVSAARWFCRRVAGFRPLRLRYQEHDHVVAFNGRIRVDLAPYADMAYGHDRLKSSTLPLQYLDLVGKEAASYRDRMKNCRPLVALQAFKIPIVAGDVDGFGGVIAKVAWAPEVEALPKSEWPISELSRIVDALEELVGDVRLILADELNTRMKAETPLPVLADTAAPGGNAN